MSWKTEVKKWIELEKKKTVKIFAFKSIHMNISWEAFEHSATEDSSDTANLSVSLYRYI